jgi:hypothetical protein
MRFTVFSAGEPDYPTLEAIEELAAVIDRWELILPPNRFDLIPSAPVRLAVAPIVAVGGPDHHFVSQGFDPHAGVPDLACDDLVFRIGWNDPIEEFVDAAVARSLAAGRGTLVNLQMPRRGEAVPFDDDDAVAERIVEATMRSPRESWRP